MAIELIPCPRPDMGAGRGPETGQSSAKLDQREQAEIFGFKVIQRLHASLTTAWLVLVDAGLRLGSGSKDSGFPEAF